MRASVRQYPFFAGLAFEIYWWVISPTAARADFLILIDL